MKGFTLLELILTMTLLGIVVTVAGLLMGRGVDAYRLVASRTQMVQSARIAMVKMQKELESLSEVDQVASDQISFQDSLGNDIKYSVTGGTLLRNNDILAQGVSGLTFTFFRENGNETNAATQVRRIHIEMELDGGPGAGRLPLRSDIFPRNFIYENYR